MSIPEYITLQKAARQLPHNPHMNTMFRWCNKGYCGIKLTSWRIGNRRVTTQDALEEFIAATTGSQESAAQQTSTAHQQAEAELDAMGVA